MKEVQIEFLNFQNYQEQVLKQLGRDYSEVVLCDTDEEMARISDEYAPEHLEVQTKNLKWFHDRLKNYGSLFIGEKKLLLLTEINVQEPIIFYPQKGLVNIQVVCL